MSYEKRFPNLQYELGHDIQNTWGMTDKPSAATDPAYGFVDLRLMRDDKTVHRNPNKGWFWHYIDNGISDQVYRDKHDPADDLADFPGLNHLYLRFDWADIEKEKGVYDFSYLDEIMELWGPRGYTFQLRVVTYENYTPQWSATPEYVFEEGARCYHIPRSGDVPTDRVQVDFGDPIYLHYLEKFMAALGAKYNGDPRIELIDIGTIGTWGEGHTVEGDNRLYPLDVVKRHFDLHAKYFPDTFVVCNDDHIFARMWKGQDEVQEMLEYARARGFGAQDDSICCDGYTQACDYDTMRAPFIFDELYRQAPCVIEMAHYRYILPKYEMHYRGGLTAMESFKRSHATFAGFHAYPRPWLEKEKYLAEYCANRLGYWYFIHSARVPDMQASKHNCMFLNIENKGWAPAYRRYDMKVMLKSKVSDYTYVCDVDCDNRNWLDGESYNVALRPNFTGVPEGEYDLYVGLFAGERPVYFALKDEICEGGFYRIREGVKVSAI